MKKLKPLENKWENVSKGCLNCGASSIKAPMNMRLYQSFGGHHVTKDGKDFFMPQQETVSNPVKWEEWKTLQYVENRARKYPRSDFRLIAEMPLYRKEWQRQGKNNWVMIKSGNGFA